MEGAIKVRLRGAVHHLLSGFVAAFFTLLIVVAALRDGSDGLGFLVPLLPVLVGALVVLAAWPPALLIGRDGVQIGPWWARRFIPAKQIAAVRRHESGISLELTDETMIVLPLVGSRDRIPSLVDRLETVLHASRFEGAPLERLARDGRSLAAWRASLADAVKPGGFRDARLTGPDCEAALADGTLSGEQRIAAALALVASGMPGSTERIRVASASTADPKVRIALQKVADESPDRDEAIEEALLGEGEVRR
ncbi:MAG: hypothetical protein JNK04_05850 [Myxococcales bacterium]|nr:hypothetical protein [Myxococcales bacterium]